MTKVSMARPSNASRCSSSKCPSSIIIKSFFMTRPIQEVVDSQRKMINRLATKGAELEIEQLQRSLTAHRNEKYASGSRGAAHGPY